MLAYYFDMNFLYMYCQQNSFELDSIYIFFQEVWFLFSVSNGDTYISEPGHHCFDRLMPIR